MIETIVLPVDLWLANVFGVTGPSFCETLLAKHAESGVYLQNGVHIPALYLPHQRWLRYDHS